MITTRKTLIVIAAVVVLGGIGKVALGQQTFSTVPNQNVTPLAAPPNDVNTMRWNSSSDAAYGTIETRPGYIDPRTGFMNSGVPVNGTYLPPFGSPNSSNGAPMGPVGNTGTNQVPGVVGRNPGFGNATGTQTFPTNDTWSGSTQSVGSPQSSGPLNSAPNGAAGTYGYPNGVDPNGALNNAGATFRNTEAGRGTTSGTTGSINSVPFGTTGNSDISATPTPAPR